MSSEDHTRATRAAQRRATMQVRLMPSHPGDEHDFSPISGAAAMSLAAKLSCSTWTLAGNAMPKYTRASIPVHFTKCTSP